MDEALVGGLIKGGAGVAATLAKDILAYLTKAGKITAARIGVDLELSFKKYLDRNYKKISKIKTLLNTSSPINLELTFESPNLTIGNKSYNEDHFLDFVESNNFVVLTAMGGSGKSVLMKHFFIRYYNEGRGRVPIFVELRNIPANVSVSDYINHILSEISPHFDADLFQYSMNAGKFIFLLDGFDEIDHDRRASIGKEILSLSYAFSENCYVITSRPDNIFEGWSEFHAAQLEGFTKKQVISLVKKLRYNKSIKSEFLKIIRDGNLFQTHGSYLANPLLCNIMLLTFNQGAEIPTKMHLFFSNTFDVLFNRHDAQKEAAFRRKFYTDLASDDFKNAMSAFSAFSYLDHGPSMHMDKANSYAKAAIEYYKFDCKPSNFISDMCSSISLLIEEGSNISYIHRSFQEYFAALFLSSSKIDGWYDIITHILVAKSHDSVIDMLREINRERFDEDFLTPAIHNLMTDLESIDILNNPFDAFKLFYIDVATGTGERKNKISSWTISTRDVIPKWTHLSPFITELMFLNMLDDFDWDDHFSRFPGHVTRSEDQIRCHNPSNEIFLGTPMANFFIAIRDHVISIHEQLLQSKSSRQNVFSSAVLQKLLDHRTASIK